MLIRFPLMYMTYFHVVMQKELPLLEIIYWPNNKILISVTKDQNMLSIINF